MKKHEKQALTFLRVLIGWLIFYAGLSKVLNPDWTAAGFLNGAENFSEIYGWFAKPGNIGWVDFLNQWGQLAIGLGLITGTFTRLASYAGILLMALYYFPSLDFPYIGHGMIVDEHIVYIGVLVVLAEFNAGQYWGLDKGLKKTYKFKGWWF
ncbi:MAG: DoxX family protein [bacterium]|nr:DoxX family protein [bacterium]